MERPLHFYFRSIFRLIDLFDGHFFVEKPSESNIEYFLFFYRNINSNRFIIRYTYEAFFFFEYMAMAIGFWSWFQKELFIIIYFESHACSYYSCSCYWKGLSMWLSKLLLLFFSFAVCYVVFRIQIQLWASFIYVNSVGSKLNRKKMR